MKRKTVFIFVNGIRTFPGDSDNWNGKAVTATLSRGPDCVAAEKVEYYTLAITRGMLQAHRAAKLRKVLSRYPDDSFCRVLVGHSNGCDVIVDALNASMRAEPVDELLLISPAIGWDCEKTGLSALLRAGIIRNPLHLWIGGKDRALRLGGSFLGGLFGYGALGLRGPKPGSLSPESAIIRTEPEFGHSTWFEDAHIDDTFDRIWNIGYNP